MNRHRTTYADDCKTDNFVTYDLLYNIATRKQPHLLSTTCILIYIYLIKFEYYFIELGQELLVGVR